MTKRKVILFIATSLDGYIARTDGSIDWLDLAIEQPVSDTSYEDFYARIDTVIMGRTTYDQVTQELSPEIYPYSDKTSYVMTSKEEIDLPNIFFRNQSIVDLVNSLKAEPGKDIWLIGGQKLIAPLVEKDMIDEYQITVIPKLLGDGIPLFTKGNFDTTLELTKNQAINGLLYMTYEKKS